MKHFMRILALIPGGIADQLLFFPTLSALHAAYPGSKIDVVVEPRAIAAYQISPDVAERISFDFAARNSLADWGNLLGIIRDREYQIVIAPQPNLSLSLLLWLSGVPTRITYANSPGAGLFTTKVAVPEPGTYAAERYYQLLSDLDQTGTTCPDLKVAPPKAALDWSDVERQRLGLGNDGYVVIYGTDTGYPANSWEAIVLDFQKKQPDLPLVLLQDSQNATLAATLKERIPTLKISQPTGLGQTIGLLVAASLVLSEEGELIQAAIASQTFTLGLFNQANPAVQMPQTDRCTSIKSPDKLADIAPATILDRVWNG